MNLKSANYQGRGGRFYSIPIKCNEQTTELYIKKNCDNLNIKRNQNRPNRKEVAEMAVLTKGFKLPLELFFKL